MSNHKHDLYRKLEVMTKADYAGCKKICTAINGNL